MSNNVSKEQIGAYLKEFESLSRKKRSVKVTPGIEGWAETKANNYWHVKFDRTCGPLGKLHDYGWEVASFIGAGHDDLAHVARAANWLSRNGAETNHNCGLHMHVEVADFSPVLAGCLLARWIQVEERLYDICHPCRRFSDYCRPLRHRYLDETLCVYDPLRPEVFWSNMAPTNFAKHDNHDKRYAINSLGYAMFEKLTIHDRATMELRLPECILEESHILNWGRLFINFVDSVFEQPWVPLSVQSCNTVDEFLICLGLADHDTILVLDDDLLKAKMWLLQKLVDIGWAEAQERLDFISRL